MRGSETSSQEDTDENEQSDDEILSPTLARYRNRIGKTEITASGKFLIFQTETGKDFISVSELQDEDLPLKIIPDNTKDTPNIDENTGTQSFWPKKIYVESPTVKDHRDKNQSKRQLLVFISHFVISLIFFIILYQLLKKIIVSYLNLSIFTVDIVFLIVTAGCFYYLLRNYCNMNFRMSRLKVYGCIISLICFEAYLLFFEDSENLKIDRGQKTIIKS